MTIHSLQEKPYICYHDIISLQLTLVILPAVFRGNLVEKSPKVQPHWPTCSACSTDTLVLLALFLLSAQLSPRFFKLRSYSPPFHNFLKKNQYLTCVNVINAYTFVHMWHKVHCIIVIPHPMRAGTNFIIFVSQDPGMPSGINRPSISLIDGDDKSLHVLSSSSLSSPFQ